MEEFKDEDFIKFIQSYKYGSYEDKYNNIHKFYDTISELSRSDTFQARPGRAWDRGSPSCA